MGMLLAGGGWKGKTRRRAMKPTGNRSGINDVGSLTTERPTMALVLQHGWQTRSRLHNTTERKNTVDFFFCSSSSSSSHLMLLNGV